MSFDIPNLTLLRQFVVTAEEGGMSKAAKRLRISQPALSKNIRKLETMLDTSLFERHAGGINLTEAGELFLERAQVIGLEYQHALQDIKNILSDQDSTIKIGAGPIWSSTILPQVAEKFHRVFPRHRLQVQVAPLDELSDDLRLGRIDIFAGAIVETTRQPGMIQRRLARADMVVLAGGDHPLLSHEGPIAPSEIAEQPFVAFAPSSEVIVDLTRYLRSKGARAPRIVLETSSLYACVEMVRSGKYLLYETQMLCESRIGRHLTPLSLPDYHRPFDLGVIHREGLDRIPQYRNLMRYMAEELGATLQQ